MAEKIYIGSDINNPLYTFDNATMTKCACVLSSSLSGDELSIDQFMPVVYSAGYIRVKFVPLGSTGLRTADGRQFMVYPDTGFLDKLPYATPIWYYSNDKLIGKFYSQRIVRSGKTRFDVLAVSAVGILDGQKHNGGIYTGQTFEAVAEEIIGSSFPFSCAANVASIPIYGWLPIGSKRDNLHQLLFACGVGLFKDEAGEILFRFPDTEEIINIPDSRIYLGGTVDYMTPATRVEVTEHLYEALESDETVTLFDNTQSGSEIAEKTLVTFSDAPVHDLAVTGTLTIDESGVNYAVVSGLGTLTGQKYTHITRVVQRSDTNDGEDKLVSVTDATLVNVANSENVAKRVYSYYSSVRTIHADVVLEGERPGDQISFNNPFDEPETAFLSSMDINASSFLRASCELVTGYLPSGGGNNYTRTVVLTGSGVWKVPDDIPVDGDGKAKIRVAIIGGGSGAAGGQAGESADSLYYLWSLEHQGITRTEKLFGDGTGELDSSTIPANNYVCDGGSPGSGGSPGIPGKGGKILVLTLTVAPGQSFAYVCGVGGLGGEGAYIEGGLEINGQRYNFGTFDEDPWEGTSYNPNFTLIDPTAGQVGTDTTFGGYSSVNGVQQDYGYFDVITNTLYGAFGDAGNPGGNGYDGGSISGQPSPTAPSANTEEVAAAIVAEDGKGPNPGQAGYGTWAYSDASGSPDTKKWFSAAGGGTGGAAYGSAAPKGGSTTTGEHFGNSDLYAPGIGAEGAAATVPAAVSVIGKGGQGGNGGGGGSPSGALWSAFGGIWYTYRVYRYGGLGGAGSAGGAGGPGGIIINL